MKKTYLRFNKKIFVWRRLPPFIKELIMTSRAAASLENFFDFECEQMHTSINTFLKYQTYN